MSEDINRFKAQCFLFACNKLDPKETAWMQEMLRRHPALQEDVDADIALAQHARQALAEEREAADVQALVPFEQIRRTLLTQQPTKWTERLAAWWYRQASTPVRTGRWALAVMLVLGVMITLQTNQFFHDDVATTQFRTVEGGGVQVAVLEVVFKGDVTIGQIREQLSTLSLHILSGPDRTGLYELEVSRGSLQDALTALQESGLVMKATIQDLRGRDSR